MPGTLSLVLLPEIDCTIGTTGGLAAGLAGRVGGGFGFGRVLTGITLPAMLSGKTEDVTTFIGFVVCPTLAR